MYHLSKKKKKIKFAPMQKDIYEYLDALLTPKVPHVSLFL